MKKEDFIQKAKAIHGDKFDYSLVPDEVNWKDKIPMICHKHGQFTMTLSNHVSNVRGCAKCGFEHVSNLKTKRSEIRFFEVAPEVHKNKYDYSKVIFKTLSTKVIITCPKHGDFKQIPEVHLRGQGCSKCGRELSGLKQSDTAETFIEKAKKVHGNLYDYSEAVYTTQVNKVKIICCKHGAFYQQPNNHLTGKNGCPMCLPEKLSKANRADENEIRGRVLEICKERGYQLLTLEYKNSNSFCELVCQKHGTFRQRLRALFNGHGCVPCGVEKSAIVRSRDIDYYLPKFVELFKDAYDYTNSEILNSKTKFEVLCKEHGVFKTTVSNHIRGKGCPKCGEYLCGYKSTRVGTFYILKITEDVIKFGISNVFDNRLKSIKNKSVFDIEVLYTFTFEDGKIAREIEERVLFSDIQRSVVNRSDMKSGYTETCYISELSKILDIVYEYKDQFI